MYIAYVSSPSNVKITQIHNIISASAESKLSDAGKGSFKIKSDNIGNDPEILQEFFRVKLFKQDPVTGKENLLIDGYIDYIQAENNVTEVWIWDMIDFLQNRYLWIDKNYFWKSLQYILNDVLSDISSRYDNWFILDCGVTDILPDKEYFEGQDILSVFKDLTEDGYEFFIDNNVIYFKAKIWIDRTLSWENYREYNFDVNNPRSRSIENPKTLFNSKNIANWVKVKDTTSVETQIDTPSKTKYWAVERFFPSLWKDATTAAEILSERKESVREISFTPITRNYFEVEIWDDINIFINSDNIFNNYIGPSRIIEKSYKSWDLENISLKTSTSKVKTLTFPEQIRKLKESQKILEY